MNIVIDSNTTSAPNPLTDNMNSYSYYSLCSTAFLMPRLKKDDSRTFRPLLDLCLASERFPEQVTTMPDSAWKECDLNI